MVQTMSVWQLDAITPVASFGATFESGWTTVATLPLSVWLSGTGRYAMWITGHVGDFVFSGSPSRQTVEVGFSDDVTPGVFERHTLGFSDGTLNGNTVHNRSSPFQALLLYDLVDWNAARSLVIKARRFLNGDAANAATGGFSVSNLAVMVFDLARLNIATGKVMTHRFTPSGGAEFANTSTEGSKQWSLSPAYGTAGEKWLVISAACYEPRNTGGAPWLSTVAVPTGLWPSAERLFGSNGRMGHRPRGAQLGINAHRYHHGGFNIRTLASTATERVGLSGNDNHSNTAQRTRLISWQVLAVRISQQAYLKFVSLASATIAGQGNELQYQPLEMENAYLANQVLMFNCIHFTLGHSFRTYARMEIGPYTVDKTNRLSSYNDVGVEGTPATLIGFRASAAPGMQHRAFVQRNPFEPTGSESFEVHDVCMAAFDVDDDPNPVPLPQEVAGAIVSIGMSFEAPGLASLPELPIEPTFAIEVAKSVAQNELRTEMGYVLTWPSHLKPMGEWSINFEPLTRADLTTLLAFLEAQPTAAFKWRPPWKQAFVGFGLVADPQSRDLGVTQGISLRCVELRYIGP